MKIIEKTPYTNANQIENEIRKSIFSERETAYIIYQILSSIRYCHKMRVVHRDVRPENIMIMGRENELLQVKLIKYNSLFYYTSIYFKI